jgi:hypothetical protein
MPQPPGYLLLQHSRAELVAAESVVAALGSVLDRKTLYAWAATHPKRRPYAGRITAYGAPLPNGSERVVVRHSHHGGLLARFTQDRFLPPTRAPEELEASLRLAEAGIPTPRVVAYAIYPAGRFFCRSDVVTEEIAPARDLGLALKEARDPAARRDLLMVVAPLLAALAGAGVWHPDLNIKNILIGGAPEARRAYLLDLDRVRFGTPNDPVIARANLARLRRSARKWRTQHSSGFSEAELHDLEEMAAGGGER